MQLHVKFIIMKMKSLLFCCVFALCANMYTAKAQVNVQDSLALVDLYNSTNGPNWSNHTNWLTKAPVSTWYGIIVRRQRVWQIRLSQNNLSGSISSSIGDRDGLALLDLSYNQLGGRIPWSFGHLRLIQDLSLAHNNLSGNIPSSFGNLGAKYYSVDIDLSNNQLTGIIPSSLGNIVNLSSLYLNNNRLRDSIPSSLGNFKKFFRSLDLSYNELTGSIPSTLGNLGNTIYGSIYSIHLNNNRLSGTIPSSLGKLKLETPLYLSHNHFTFDGMELIARVFRDAIYNYQKNIPIHQKGNTLSVYAGGTLSNNTYTWFRWDGTTSKLVATIIGDSTFHPSENGRYRVKVTNSIATQLQLYSPLFDYKAPTNAVIASADNALQQDDKANLFRVYPNPAKDILHIETNGATIFSLIDQSGKVLLTTNITGKGSINISGITPGLYYLKNNSNRSVQKVVIAR